MAEMPSDFWGGWIAIITATSLIGLTWAVFSVYFSRKGQTHSAQIWDESLEEGANAPPLWWFWMILALLVFSVVYLILYPGLGSANGIMLYSHGGHLEHTRALYEETFEHRRAQIASTPMETLQADPVAMGSAERVFKQNCAACHGSGARGQAAMFPDLTDSDWQWGGQPEQIEETIRMGRQAMMPAHGTVVGSGGVAQLVQYISALSSGAPVEKEGEETPSHELFERYCFACHGRDAKGNALVGAPNLTDGIWLYGGSAEALTNTITNGRNGIMPPFQQRLDDVQVRLLVAWLTRRAATAPATGASGE